MALPGRSASQLPFGPSSDDAGAHRALADCARPKDSRSVRGRRPVALQGLRGSLDWPAGRGRRGGAAKRGVPQPAPQQAGRGSLDERRPPRTRSERHGLSVDLLAQGLRWEAVRNPPGRSESLVEQLDAADGGVESAQGKSPGPDPHSTHAVCAGSPKARPCAGFERFKGGARTGTGTDDKNPTGLIFAVFLKASSVASVSPEPGALRPCPALDPPACAPAFGASRLPPVCPHPR